MEVKLQLSVFMLLIQASVGVWQRVTVMEGGSLTLSCPITRADKNHVEWKNPQGYIMFFNNKTALKDKRYSINRLSNTEFTISISKVTFKDGGNYTCSQYYHSSTKEKTVELTVLGHPRMEVAKHDRMFVITCTAAGNHYPPQISWNMGQGIEFTGQAHIFHEDGIRKYVSVEMLHVKSLENRVTVKCLVRHPALHSKPLMKFVKIGRNSAKFPQRTSTSSPTARPQSSTDVPRTTIRWLRNESTIATPVTTHLYRSSESSTTLTASSKKPETVTASTGFNLNTSTHSQQSTIGSTQAWNSTVRNSTNPTGWTLASGATANSTSYNSTEGNSTSGSFNELEKHMANKGNFSLLVLLVTCLIFALLVVVIFFAIKLRKAHIIWKRENEDSEQSSEGSKSKSSHEEKQTQGQRRRGLFSMAFTQYVAEEPTVITTPSTNTTETTAAGSTTEEQTSQAHIPTQISARNNIKETEL